MDSGSKEAPIPVPNISSKTMKKVVEFCSYHYEHRVEEGISFTSKDCFDRDFVVISDWDKEFFNVPVNVIFDILMVSFLFFIIIVFFFLSFLSFFSLFSFSFNLIYHM